MTLGHKRMNGVHLLIVSCSNVACRHEAIVNVDVIADDVPVPSLGPRMRSQRCGELGADARPNWKQRPAIGSLHRRRERPTMRPHAFHLSRAAWLKVSRAIPLSPPN